MSLNICITLVQSNHPNISCITSSRLEVASPLNISLNMTRSTASLTNLKTPAWERCFVHSRLLERSAKLSYNLGGSSKLSSHPLAHSSSQDQHVWTILIAPMSSSNIQHLHLQVHTPWAISFSISSALPLIYDLHSSTKSR